jgi:hypothetical protein
VSSTVRLSAAESSETVNSATFACDSGMGVSIEDYGIAPRTGTEGSGAQIDANAPILLSSDRT